MTINELAPGKRDHCPSETDVASLESKHAFNFRRIIGSSSSLTMGSFWRRTLFSIEGRRYSLPLCLESTST